MKLYIYLFFLLPFLSIAQTVPEEDQVFSIYFGGGSYYIDDQQISDFVLFLNDISDLNACEIEIHGHTDNIGSMVYNQWLSEMRSESVLNQLLLQNIPNEKVRVHSFGETSPVYNNESWNGKLHNRRVDVIIKRLAM